jgi:hypothetical protein
MEVEMGSSMVDVFSCDKECDTIAEIWVKGGNTLQNWKDESYIIAWMVDYNKRDSYSTASKCAEFWDSVDGDGDGLLRCSREIEGWIVSHLAARGR